MSRIDAMILSIDGPAGGAVWRAVAGCVTAALQCHYLESRGHTVSLLGVALVVLLMMRVGAAVLRRIVPASPTVKAAWASRRLAGRRYDSFQWRKLLGFGLGVVAYQSAASTCARDAVVTGFVIVVAGLLGEFFWRRARDHVPAAIGVR